MRLFSEKVKPTFTSSNLNILTVKDYQEIFFDVFEFEINGKKFIAEKTSEYRGFPVVDIPLVLEGKKLTAPFVLQQGEFEVLFNENNSKFIELEKEDRELVFEESKEVKDEIEDIIFEKREDILNEINSARQSAVRFIEKLKLEKLDQANKEIEKSKNFFKDEINNSKKDLLEEFISLINATKSDLASESDQFKDNLTHFVENKIEKISDKLAEDIDSKQQEAETRFSEQINELATNILSGVLLKELDNKANTLTDSFNNRYESISIALKDVIKEHVSLLEKNLNIELTENNNEIVNLQKANVELNDKINKDTNRALSRIGNIKTQLDESLQATKEDIATLMNDTSDKLVADITTKFNQADEDIVESIVQKISKAEEKITEFYESKINAVRQELENTTEQNRGDILRLIDESRHSILTEVSNIKIDVPNIVIERANGKQTVDLKGIKTELEKVIGTRFSNELQSLKRLIEMSSGGGSVAKQFAAGGTMDGDLTVVGRLSAIEYLGISIPTGDYLPLSGGTVTGDVTVTGGLSASRIYTDQLDALSANITIIDIKQYELSGFNVQGNSTIQGNVSASGTITASNLIYKNGNADNTALTVGTNDGYSLNFETNGTTRMFVTSSGEFGFGLATIQPGFKFEVTGLSKFANDIYAGSSLRMYNSAPAIVASDLKLTNSSNTPIMMLSSNGNVGIGTTTPSEKLAVVDNAVGTGIVASISGNSNSSGTLLRVRGGASSGGSLFLVNNTTASSIFRITETGAILHNQDVFFNRAGGAVITLGGINNTNTFYTVNSGNHTATDYLFRGGLADRTAGKLFQVNNFNIPILTITALTSGGNVGIGTTTPNEKLTVTGNISATGNLSIGGGLVTPIKTVNSNTTLLSTDYAVLVDASSSNISVQLPAASLNTGRTYHVKKIDSTTKLVTLSGNISETIDGLNTQAINTQYISLTIISNGSNWFII